MNALRQGFKLLKYNISSIVLFEILYKLLATAVLTPILYAMFMYSFKIADIDYLNTNNIGSYFTSPFTYVTLFLVLMILSEYVMVHMSGLIYAYEASFNEKKANPVVVFLKAVFNSLRVVRPRNMMFSVYVLFIMPFTYTIVISASIAGVRIPEYLEHIITKNKTLFSIMVALYGLLSIYSMLRIFSLNFFSLYRMGYKTAVAESKKLIKKNVFKVLTGVALLNAIITILLFGIEWLVVSGTAIILKNVVSYKSLVFIIHTVIQISFTVLYIISSIISTPVICAYICGCFYELTGEDEITGKKLVDDSREEKLLDKRKNKAITVGVIIVGILLNGLYLYLDMSKRYKLNFLFDSLPEITAHRGDSAHAPENTMAAIRLAVENQADMVEIDVRQTGDGEFVLLHDENLKRTTGYNAKIGTVDYDFVRSLDSGAKYSEEYIGERIPTLEEVLEYAGEENIFLNIELKPASTDNNYVEGVLALINKYGRAERCVVASQNYKLLKEVKLMQPELKTVLILNMAIGALGDMEDIDVYSVRYNFITAGMVRDAHKNGKEVYAWTVNGEETIKRLMLMDVDSIITDKPYSTKEIVYTESENFVTDMLKRLLEEY